jgi:hypothetical protein
MYRNEVIVKKLEESYKYQCKQVILYPRRFLFLTYSGGFQVGTKSGDGGGAGPEPRRYLLGKVRGGNTLLLGTVRFARGKLRGGERGEACGGAAAAIERDPQRAGGGGAVEERGGEVPQLEGEAAAVWVQGHLFGWKCRNPGYPAPRHVPF